MAGDFDAFVRNSDKMLEDMREIKEMLRDLLEPPIFSGKDPEQWLQRIEAYFGFNRTPSNLRFSIVEKCIAIFGKHWFSLLSELCPYLTWSKFKEFFMERFGPSEVKVNKEVETDIVEVMNPDSGSYSKEAEDGGDGMKQIITEVDSGSFIIPTFDNHQEEVSRAILIVDEEDRSIQHGEDKKLLLSPAAAMNEIEEGDPGQQKGSLVVMGQGHLSKQLMGHFRPKTATWIPFYVDTGQENPPVLKVHQPHSLQNNVTYLSSISYFSTAPQHAHFPSNPSRSGSHSVGVIGYYLSEEKKTGFIELQKHLSGASDTATEGGVQLIPNTHFAPFLHMFANYVFVIAPTPIIDDMGQRHTLVGYYHFRKYKIELFIVSYWGCLVTKNEKGHWEEDETVFDGVVVGEPRGAILDGEIKELIVLQTPIWLHEGLQGKFLLILVDRGFINELILKLVELLSCGQGSAQILYGGHVLLQEQILEPLSTTLKFILLSTSILNGTYHTHQTQQPIKKILSNLYFSTDKMKLSILLYAIRKSLVMKVKPHVFLIPSKLQVFCLVNYGDCLKFVQWVSINKELVKWLGRLSCAQLNDGNIAIEVCKSLLVYYDGIRTSFRSYPLVLFSHFVQFVDHGFVVCIDEHLSKSVLVKMNRSLPFKRLRNLCVQHSIGAPWILMARLNVGVQPKTWEFGLVGSINTRKKIMFPAIKKCGGFQLLASYFIERIRLGICNSMIRVQAEAQQNISKFLMVLAGFEDDHRASIDVASREIVSIHWDNCNSKISVSLLLTTRTDFQWLIAWRTTIFEFASPKPS